jgi:ech hydrogenase subunit F
VPRMMKNVLRNFMAPRATRRYPAEVRDPFPGARGELVNAITDCIFCATCARKCPSQCLEVSKQEATWTLHAFACVQCGICVESCPVKCLSQKTAHRQAADKPEVIILKGESKKKEHPVGTQD